MRSIPFQQSILVSIFPLFCVACGGGVAGGNGDADSGLPNNTPDGSNASDDGGAPTQPGSLDLPRVPWEGRDYYKQFAKADAAGWDDPGFFPIAVFFGKPGHASSLKAVGVNTYMGAEHDGSTINSITDTGMFVLAQGEWTTNEVGDNPNVVGWHVSDECDMGYSGCTPDFNNDNGENGRLAIHQQMVAEFRAKNDGRFLQANFGNGVMRTYWAPNTMDDHVALVDASSVDKYAYSSPSVRGLFDQSPDWPSGGNAQSSAAYGWMADQMRTFQDSNHLRPIWVFVETRLPYLFDGNDGPEQGSHPITPNEIEGAMWSSIIHEARGIAFFQHNNDASCGNYSIVQCGDDLRNKIKSVTDKIKLLAPAINSQSYVYDFDNGTDTMLKEYDGAVYIFADIGVKETTGSKTFTLPPGVSGTTVTVVSEDRTLPVENGSFTDTFANEYTHHVYKISL